MNDVERFAEWIKYAVIPSEEKRILKLFNALVRREAKKAHDWGLRNSSPGLHQVSELNREWVKVSWASYQASRRGKR